MEVVKVYVPSPAGVVKVYSPIAGVDWANIFGLINSNTQLMAELAKYAPKTRVYTLASATTLTLDLDLYDEADLTSLASNVTIANPIGTWGNGKKILFRFKDNNLARQIIWGDAFVDLTGTAPSTTSVGKVTVTGARWSAARSKWEILATVTEP